MRLIDADKFKEWIDCGHLRQPSEKCFSELDICKAIDLQPTAYDVDKVVEQMNERIENLDNKNKICMNCGDFRSADRLSERMGEVINDREIVKKGGVE